jgi:hypothetical protein
MNNELTKTLLAIGCAAFCAISAQADTLTPSLITNAPTSAYYSVLYSGAYFFWIERSHIIYNDNGPMQIVVTKTYSDLSANGYRTYVEFSIVGQAGHFNTNARNVQKWTLGSATVSVAPRIIPTDDQLAQRAASDAQMAVDQAAYRSNIKSGKWHTFQNGE